MPIPDAHVVKGTPLQPPFPAGLETALFGMGCFWGAEQRFWELDGVYTTAVGYAGGTLAHPTYRDVCGGDSGHAEVVLVVFDPGRISYEQLLETFWDGHNPALGRRQGSEPGWQYRSLIVAHTDAQFSAAKASLAFRQEQLGKTGHDRITTCIEPVSPFYYAEEKHQQYLAKHRGGVYGPG